MNSKRGKKIIILIIYLLLLVSAGFLLLINIYRPAFLEWLCQEDGLLENLTSLFFFLAFYLLIYKFKQQRFQNVWYLFFGVLFFVIAGEEISWGQRIFGFVTPENLKQINVQKEFNFHNIDGIYQDFKAIGGIFFLMLFYFIPISERFNDRLKNFYQKIQVLISPLWLMGVFAIAGLFMSIPRVLLFNDKVMRQNLDEIGEFYLAFGCLLFAWDVYSKITSAVESRSSQLNLAEKQ